MTAMLARIFPPYLPSITPNNDNKHPQGIPMIFGHQPQRIAATHARPASASWPQVAARIWPQIAAACPASASRPQVVTRIQPQIAAACLAIASWPQVVTRILSQIAATGQCFSAPGGDNLATGCRNPRSPGQCFPAPGGDNLQGSQHFN